LCGRSRNCESNADIATGRREDRRIHTNHFTLHVEGRTAGVTAVHGRIDLDEIVIRTRTDVATARRHDAGGYRAAKAERIANGHRPFTDLRRIIGKVDIGKVLVALDLQQRQVGPLVGTDQGGFVFFTLMVDHGEFRTTVDHVMVGYDETVFGNKEAGALRCAVLTRRAALVLAFFTATATEIPEEALERMTVRQVLEEFIKAVAAVEVHHARLGGLLHAHTDNCGTYGANNV